MHTSGPSHLDHRSGSTRVTIGSTFLNKTFQFSPLLIKKVILLSTFSPRRPLVLPLSGVTSDHRYYQMKSPSLSCNFCPIRFQKTQLKNHETPLEVQSFLGPDLYRPPSDEADVDLCYSSPTNGCYPHSNFQKESRHPVNRDLTIGGTSCFDLLFCFCLILWLLIWVYKSSLTKFLPLSSCNMSLDPFYIFLFVVTLIRA